MLLLGPVHAQEKRFSAALDSSNIRIGEQVTLVIQATFPVAEKIQFILPTDTLTEKIEILTAKNDTVFSDDLLHKTIFYSLLITSFDSGYHVIPPFLCVLSDTDTLQSNPLLLSVYAVPVDTAAGLRDVKEPYDAPFNLLDWLLYYKYPILAVLVLLALAYGLYRFLKYRKKESQAEALPEVRIPPHVLALQKLHELENKKYWQAGEIKIYYSELTDILREYIQAIYQVDAPEQTTEETIQALRLLIPEREIKNTLRSILQLADMVKFAKEKPLPVENENCIKQAIAFIEATKPKQAEETAKT